MDLAFTAEEISFRDDVRAFISDRLPEELAAKVRNGHKLEKADHIRWQRILNEQGWAAPNWPAEYGGPGLECGAALHLRRGVQRVRRAAQPSPWGKAWSAP